ncbi:hypothetical protein [Corallococcus sp. AB038B]|uniref:hypothetical protein n=1 Tax=Corallococcus sp. AB038B TaxID=2316718 RepID=UPI0013153723|nr:hypothetical protein [Corallococcus sp. AB038B]
MKHPVEVVQASFDVWSALASDGRSSGDVDAKDAPGDVDAAPADVTVSQES